MRCKKISEKNCGEVKLDVKKCYRDVKKCYRDVKNVIEM